MMKKLNIIIPIAIVVGIVISCSVELYLTNGETIYRTGHNQRGETILDKAKSQNTFIKSCQGCHGKTGDRISYCNIKWSHLADPKKMSIPYNDTLFFRFLDKDVKSDGSPAQTGVHWEMSLKDKKDLMEFLKKL